MFTYCRGERSGNRFVFDKKMSSDPRAKAVRDKKSSAFTSDTSITQGSAFNIIAMQLSICVTLHPCF